MILYPFFTKKDEKICKAILLTNRSKKANDEHKQTSNELTDKKEIQQKNQSSLILLGSLFWRAMFELNFFLKHRTMQLANMRTHGAGECGLSTTLSVYGDLTIKTGP